VQDLSRLLFNRHGGNPREIKANILEFNGFVFADEKAEVRALLFDGCACLCTQGASIFLRKKFRRLKRKAVGALRSRALVPMHTRKMSRYDAIAGEHENADTQEGDERPQGNHDVSGARANRYFDS
jgi:hypothetical protein